MFRFDHMIRSSMTARDVKARFPQTASVFERLGFREACDDCPIDVAARRLGLTPLDVTEELNQFVFSSRETV